MPVNAYLAVAVLLIEAGVPYVRQVERSVEQRFRHALREAKAAGKLLPGVDPETAPRADLGIPMTASEMRRIELAHLLVAWRLVLIPLVLIGSLAIARWTGRQPP